MKRLTLSSKFGINPGFMTCYWCHKDYGIILYGANRGKEAPKQTIASYEPCDECKEKFKQGVHVIEASEKPNGANPFPIREHPTFFPTGNYWLVRKEAAKNIFSLDDNTPTILIDKETAERVGLYGEQL